MLGMQALDLQMHRAGAAPEHQAVLEVVEHQLLVGAVGDVAGIGGAPRGRLHALGDGAHRKPEEAVHRLHPFGVAQYEEVVDGDDVHRNTRHRGGAGRQRGGEGLALAGFHFGDLAVEHHAATQQLHVERAHPQAPFGDLAHQRERLGHQGFLEALAVERAAQFRHTFAQLRVGQVRETQPRGIDAIEKIPLGRPAAVGALANEAARAGGGAVEPVVAQVFALRIRPERDAGAQRGGARH